MSTQRFLAKNTFMVAFLLGLSSILGLIRESATAYQFGATGVMDAYLIAMIIPTLFVNLVKGSVTNTFITVYGGYLAQGEEEAGWTMANVMISLFIVALSMIALILLLLTTPLVRLVAPSYEGTQLALAVSLTRTLLPNVVFGGVMGILVGINNAHRSFFAPSIIFALANVIVILSIFFLGPILGIQGLALGALLGTFAQLIIQIPTARKLGWRFRFSLDLSHTGVRETLFLVTPFILSAAASQVNLIVDRTLATGLPQGMVSALYFANKLVFLPQSVFTAALGMVVFPILVQSAARGDWSNVVEGMYRAVRLLSLILWPAMMGIYVLRYPFVQLLFEHGAFTAQDSVNTAMTVPYFLGALLFGGLVMILMNIYFAAKKMAFVVGTGVISLLTNILFSLWLIHPLQQRGLALANTLSAGVNVLFLTVGLFLVLRLHEKVRLPWREGFDFAWRMILAVFIMGIFIGLVQGGMGPMLQGRRGVAVLSLSGVGVGVLVYVGMLYLLEIQEVRKGIAVLKRLLKRV